MVRRYGRAIALTLLVLATWVGLQKIGWEGFERAWTSSGDHGATLGIVFVLAALDVALSGAVWRRVYRRLGIALSSGTAFWVYLAGYAGLLVPAQLGRLIRPDAMSRLSERPFSVCVRAEAAALLLNLISVGGLLVGLIAYALLPLAALPVAVGSVGMALFVIDRLSARLVPAWGLPARFWWNGSIAGLVGVQMLAWTAHGLGLRAVLTQTMPEVSAWEPVLHATLAALGGAVSGVPGGVGVTEWLLGGSLTLLHVPEQDLVVSVAVFRAGSQWAWLPIGWLALAALRRRTGDVEPVPEALPAGDEVA
jgi:glycosyltransferase 2 family protein